MSLQYKYGVIIQARNSSHRLKRKMSMPFYNGKSILELLINNLKVSLNQVLTVVATTNHSEDDSIVELAEKMGVQVFRGEEKNVLRRVTEAATQFGIENIIRVCGDNPFLDIDSISSLIRCHKKKPVDYISYKVGDDLPAILSHLGLFAELVMKSTLEKVIKKTSDALFLEHVTNYIYTNPNEFDLHFLKAPQYLFNRLDIRLTVDTIQDFELAQLLYSLKIENNWDHIELINFIDSDKTIKKSMNKMIDQNKK